MTIWICTALVVGVALVDGIWTSAEIQGLACLISASSAWAIDGSGVPPPLSIERGSARRVDLRELENNAVLDDRFHETCIMEPMG